MSKELTKKELLENLDELSNYGLLRISHSEKSARRLIVTIAQLKEIIKSSDTTMFKNAGVEAEE
jgi:hypothetical protein